MKPVSPWALGGTLFVPATHKHLERIANGEKFPNLRSMVIDTEDGILETELETALKTIASLLPNLKPSRLLRFVRPRNPAILKRLLTLQDIHAVDGFILPKFGLENKNEYLDLLQETPFSFMPSIEGNELFSPQELVLLRDTLLPYRSHIPLIRFGTEDMLRQLGLRRDCDRSLFDMSAPSHVIGALLGIFKPYGFEISGGVYRCYQDREGFKKDVLRDLSEGLVGKTIIHPDQIEALDECYRVSQRELEEARMLLHSNNAVFSLNGTMAETVTQSRWANAVLERESFFGMMASSHHKDNAR